MVDMKKIVMYEKIYPLKIPNDSSKHRSRYYFTSFLFNGQAVLI